ncbi:MAG: hypothetical protein NPIRA06_16790 [Nitrospirales bacterium]|nr:MAG: hypothetical protein NPIRA06_16790 [Nitrospirales bacterium]
MPEQGEILWGIHDDETRDADGGGCGKERIKEGDVNSWMSGERKHEQAGTEENEPEGSGCHNLAR